MKIDKLRNGAAWLLERAATGLLWLARKIAVPLKGS